jgi:N-acetylglucosaminyldiphosphoundecaprenol N-acetyl-beta-D-mannosaminyltransferase
MPTEPRPGSREPACYDLLGVRVSALDLDKAVARIRFLAETSRKAGKAAYVCVRDVNGIMECQRDPLLRHIHDKAALVTPDGMPVVWWGRYRGHRDTARVYGPDLMSTLCRGSTPDGPRHFLCGGGEGVAELLRQKLTDRFPTLPIVGTWTPPFRPLSPDEYDRLAQRINDSAADLVWIGLSSPKQERFMAELAPRLRSGVLIGVGAAFDFLSGLKPQAPRWIQRSGFEWLFRLATEPRRLWRRYLLGNSRFVWLVLITLHREWAAKRRLASSVSRAAVKLPLDRRR